MNRNTVKNLINILMESPLYLELTVKERYQLLMHFMDLYVSYSDVLFASDDADEPSFEARGKDGRRV